MPIRAASRIVPLLTNARVRGATVTVTGPVIAQCFLSSCHPQDINVERVSGRSRHPCYRGCIPYRGGTRATQIEYATRPSHYRHGQGCCALGGGPHIISVIDCYLHSTSRHQGSRIFKIYLRYVFPCCRGGEDSRGVYGGRLCR